MFKKLTIATLALILAAAGSLSAIQAMPVQAAAGALLTSDEESGLLYMFEEEKLARDVYLALYDLWGESIFQVIAGSEQRHMDAVSTLLVSNGISVPETDTGVFTDPMLQSLYADLMAAGSLSVEDALKTAALIEETDINDLQTYLAATSESSLQRVYTHLLRGSSQHLRKFAGAFELESGETYQPQVLDAGAYAEILASKMGHGRGGRMGSGMGSQGSGTCTGTGPGTIPDDAITGMGRGHRGGR